MIEPCMTSVACALGSSVITSSTDFSFQKLIFQNLFEFFQGQKSLLKKQYLPHFDSKSYQINSIKSCSSKSFPWHQRQFQSILNFQLLFNLIFSEEIIQYSRTFASQVQTLWKQADAPLLLKSFPKRPRMWSEASWFSGSHKYKTKTKQTNYLPS